jgi:hypothetical protein
VVAAAAWQGQAVPEAQIAVRLWRPRKKLFLLGYLSHQNQNQNQIGDFFSARQRLLKKVPDENSLMGVTDKSWTSVRRI